VSGRLTGKVALVTGAARGQGRAHSIRLAREGADVVAVDICAPVDTAPYPLATPEDLEQTLEAVTSLGRRAVGHRADVRDHAAMASVAESALSEFGNIDIVVANAGIASFAPIWELGPEQWREMIEINLTGAFHTVRPLLPAMIEAGRGGSIVLISSVAGLAAHPNVAHYNSAKHGLVGLARSLAIELAPFGIRANSVHPTTVDTPMVHNPAFYRLAGARTREDAARAFAGANAQPVAWVEPEAVSDAVAWLVSDESRYVTGTALPVDAGGLQPFRMPARMAAARYQAAATGPGDTGDRITDALHHPEEGRV
jgi:SDR family mycofactocin-dependent oxidoreductase